MKHTTPGTRPRKPPPEHLTVKLTKIEAATVHSACMLVAITDQVSLFDKPSLLRALKKIEMEIRI